MHVCACMCITVCTIHYRPGTLREEEDVEVIIKRHNEMQEQLAEDMIRIARNMKEHQLAAKKIITDDNEASKHPSHTITIFLHVTSFLETDRIEQFSRQKLRSIEDRNRTSARAHETVMLMLDMAHGHRRLHSLHMDDPIHTHRSKEMTTETSILYNSRLEHCNAGLYI